MSLTALPTDVLILILSHLNQLGNISGPCPRDLNALHALSVCNRSLHAIATPLLYSSFEQDVEFQDVDIDRKWAGFISGITLSGAARDAVRRLTLADWNTGEEYPFESGEGDDEGDDEGCDKDKSLRMANITPDAAYVLRKALVSFLELDREEEEEINMKVEDYVFAGVLAYLPNLQQLYISVPYSDSPTMVEQVIERSAQRLWKSNKPPREIPFWNLREVGLRWWDTEGYLEAKFLTHFLKMPSLRVIDGFRIGPNHALEAPRAAKEAAKICRESPVEELILDSSDLDLEVVKTLTSSCKALRRLKLSWDCMDYYENNSRQPYTLEAIVGALEDHVDSLQEVELDSSESDIFKEQDENVGSVGTTLTTLHNLKELSINVNAIYGVEPPQNLSFVDRLPESLERLTLLLDIYDVDPVEELLIADLLRFIDSCQQNSAFRHLKKIELLGWFKDNRAERDKLKSAAEKAGIELSEGKRVPWQTD